MGKKSNKHQEDIPISTDKKRDFISIICNMSCNELNNYIKQHGKSPKKILLYKLIDNNINQKFNSKES